MWLEINVAKIWHIRNQSVVKNYLHRKWKILIKHQSEGDCFVSVFFFKWHLSLGQRSVDNAHKLTTFALIFQIHYGAYRQKVSVSLIIIISNFPWRWFFFLNNWRFSGRFSRNVYQSCHHWSYQMRSEGMSEGLNFLAINF